MVPVVSPVGRFRSIDWVESTGSTNDDLAARVRAGRREPQVLLTEEQVAGRGRRDRTWQMPRGGGLLLSAFVPWSDTASVGVIPMALSVSAREAIVATGRAVDIKWPNDLVSAGGDKVGGMLGEVIRVAGDVVGVVVGLGLNVSWPHPTSSAPPNASALDPLGVDPIDRSGLASDLLGRLDELLAVVSRSGGAAVLDRYRSGCATIGQMVRIEADTESFEGTAVAVDPNGALVVVVGGEQRVVTVADVVHLRPASSDPS